jgi:hypothetical protein
VCVCVCVRETYTFLRISTRVIITLNREGVRGRITSYHE